MNVSLLNNDAGYVTASSDSQTLSYSNGQVTISNGNSVNISNIDITGSVFGDDSALLVDSVNGKITGKVETTTVVANSITGSVYAEDSTQMLDAHSQTLYGTIVATPGATPTGTLDTGALGEIRHTSQHIYVKTSAGWKRASLVGFV